MRLISRYILRALTPPFCWGVAALTGLLLLNSLPPLIDRFGGKGLSLGVMGEAVVLLLPALLALTMPMAVLVSALYAYTQLAASLEMVAMYANGISVWRMARPALLGAAVVAVMNFLVFDQVLPESNVRLANLQDAAASKLPTLALRQQVLNNLPPPSGYVLRADRINAETSALYGVTIFDLSTYNARRLIVADSGSMAESANGRDLILTLHSGEIYDFKDAEPGRLQQTLFVHNRIVVRDVQNQLQLTANRMNRGEREKSSCELLDGVDEQRWSIAYDRRQNEFMTRRDLQILTGLTPENVPPAQARPRMRPHCGVYRRFESWFKGIMLPAPLAAQTPQQPQQPPVPAAKLPAAQVPPAAAATAVPQLPITTPRLPQQFLVPPSQNRPAGLSSFQEVTSEEFSVNEAIKTMRLYQVEYHQKFAVPLSTFCFVLIGMALALKYPGSGIGLVIGGSLVIFLSFYILLQGGKGMAAAGEIDPAIALYTPLMLFTVVGLVAVTFANREMGGARSGGIFAGVADFFRRIRE